MTDTPIQIVPFTPILQGNNLLQQYQHQQQSNIQNTSTQSNASYDLFQATNNALDNAIKAGNNSLGIPDPILVTQNNVTVIPNPSLTGNNNLNNTNGNLNNNGQHMPNFTKYVRLDENIAHTGQSTIMNQ